MSENHELLVTFGVVLALEIFESTIARKEATHVFYPKLGWRLFYFVMIGTSVFLLVLRLSGEREPSDQSLLWICVVLLCSLLVRPKTLVTNAAGLTSFGLYGFRRRFIEWNAVSIVTSDWQEGGGGIFQWFYRGYCVAVVGRDGTHVDHSVLQGRQGRFLDDLRAHLNKDVFAPGLYDWHL